MAMRRQWRKVKVFWVEVGDFLYKWLWCPSKVQEQIDLFLHKDTEQQDISLVENSITFVVSIGIAFSITTSLMSSFMSSMTSFFLCVVVGGVVCAVTGPSVRREDLVMWNGRLGCLNPGKRHKPQIIDFIRFLFFKNLKRVVAENITLGIALAVTSSVVIVSRYPALYPIIWGILAFAAAPTAAPTTYRRWLVGLITIMFFLGYENLGFQLHWTIIAIFVGYYRIFPDYLIFLIPSLFNATDQFIPSWLKNGAPSANALAIADRFPAFESEILWFPIPRHDLVLINAFKQSPSQTLTIYQKLQSNPLPGPQTTIYKALPDILANCLIAPRTTAELLETQTQSHPGLPLIIPEYYQQPTDEDAQTIAPVQHQTAIETIVPVLLIFLSNLSIAVENSSELLRERGLKSLQNKLTQLQEQLSLLIISEKRKPEITIVFPYLQTFLSDLSIILENSSAKLRRRGLESLQNELTQLQRQLPYLLPAEESVSRWQSVLIHWQTLLEVELTQQRKFSQGELLGPFQFGNPLRSLDAFKGRRTLADRILRLVLDRNRPTLVLHGPRRVGKTSFLKNLPHLIPSVIPIYLDLQSSALSSSEPDFCYGLVRAIYRDTRTQNLNLPAIPDRTAFKTNPYTTLEDWLDNALPLLPPGRRLLLNLDEFEKIGTAIADGRLSFNLLNELRHLIQHRDELAFMFSGVQTLDELGPNWSSYFISVVPIEMLYLEPHEAEDLLRNPAPDFEMRYEDGLIETICHLTHCQPYLLQLIGACLVEQANRATVKTATHDLLELAIPEAFTNGEPYFTNLWQEFTGTTPAEITAGQQILLTIAQSQTPTYSTLERQAARRRMIRFHVITDTDRIEIPLLDRWIKERAIDL